MVNFNQLKFDSGEVVLDNVLQCGQAFRWVWNNNEGYYSTSMLIGGKYDIVILKQLDECTIAYRSIGFTGTELLKDTLTNYFRMNISLNQLMKEWSDLDDHFIGKNHKGVRILNQEPWETMISFICSSNNNISRITKLCHSLCIEYGNYIGEVDNVKYYSFPTSKDLIFKSSEKQMRELGFGYRAKYIMNTANRILKDKGNMSETEYLKKLARKCSYEEVREKLLSYSGIGPKVADCICLMSLEFDDIVPIDVHMSRIAERDYKISINKKDLQLLKATYCDLPLTRKKINYELEFIRKLFKDKWGLYAGWAQGILFAKEIEKNSKVRINSIIQKYNLESREDVKSMVINKKRKIKSQV